MPLTATWGRKSADERIPDEEAIQIPDEEAVRIPDEEVGRARSVGRRDGAWWQ
jgi:hypothetical protein